MTIVIGAVCVLAGVASATESKHQPCSGADHSVEKIRSWDDLRRWWQKYSACDDGDAAEGLDRFVVGKLAASWKSLPELEAMAEQFAGFEEFVLRHVGGDAPIGSLKSIRSRAKAECPPTMADACKRVIAAVNRGLQEQAKVARYAGAMVHRRGVERELDEKTWDNVALVERSKRYPELRRLVP
jgi:hypothetical protein